MDEISNEQLAECSGCGKMKKREELTLMQEGVGIRMSKNSRITENKVRRWVEDTTGKKIDWFPHLCFDCRSDGYLRMILTGKA